MTEGAETSFGAGLRAGVGWFAALVVAGALVAACEKEGGAGADPLAELADELSEPISAVIDAWQTADLEIADVRVLDDSSDELGADIGGACVAAAVAEIPVVLCEYGGEDAAKEAEERGLELVGEATGLSLARGPLLLVAADRHEADPSGRQINEIANVFRRLE